MNELDDYLNNRKTEKKTLIEQKVKLFVAELYRLLYTLYEK